jgi:hypothetical protein
MEGLGANEILTRVQKRQAYKSVFFSRETKVTDNESSIFSV